MTAHAILATLEASNMQTESTSSPEKRLWAGRILSGIPALFLIIDGGMKLFKPLVVVEATVQLGYPESAIVGYTRRSQNRPVNAA